MFKRLWLRYVLMEEAGGSDGGGAAAGAGGAAAGAAAGGGQSGASGAAAGAGTGEAAGAASTDGAGVTPPASLLGDGSEAQSGEKKPEEGAGEKKPEAGQKPEEPIKYEAFKLPEGVTLDETKLADFTKLAGEAKLPQETAQKLVDLYAAEMKQVQEAPMRAWTDLQTKWQADVKADPVIGGANLDKNLAATKAGLNAVLGDDAKSFFEALNITGAGNNPAILRGLFKAAAPHAPASPVAGQPGKTAKSAGETLYPNQAKLGNGHEG
jgi:hypothetical protein